MIKKAEILIIFEPNIKGIALKKIITLIICLVLSGLLTQLVGRVFMPKQDTPPISNEKINLALRRTAHLLLKETGDNTSQISAIKQLKNNVWLLPLAHHFNYDSLPKFLQQSLAIHKIPYAYDVSVLNCIDGTLVLGYNVWDISNGKGVPCGGRETSQTCYNLQISFDTNPISSPTLSPFVWVLSVVLGLVAYSFSQKWNFLSPKTTSHSEDNETDWLQFGNSKLHVANQQLIAANVKHSLTYREAKLLHLFVQHQNQVLERNFILENVWADEGIIVGRSVDMFVSRLRKMLKEDNTLKLTAIHGVGYQLSVNFA